MWGLPFHAYGRRCCQLAVAPARPPSLPPFHFPVLTSGVVVRGRGPRRGGWHEGMRGAGDGGSSSQKEDGGGPGRHGEVVVVVGLKQHREAMREPCVCVGKGIGKRAT